MHGNALDDAGVVHQDVNLSYLLVDGLHKSLHVVFLGDVAHVALHVLDAGLLVVGQSALQCCLVDVVEDDVLGACSHKGLGDVETDTVAGTGNPGILAFK